MEDNGKNKGTLQDTLIKFALLRGDPPHQN